MSSAASGDFLRTVDHLLTDELRAVLDSYANAECFWVQDEPRNQGAWTLLLAELNPLLTRPLQLVSRPSSAAPATGSGKRHAQEQAALIEQALHCPASSLGRNDAAVAARTVSVRADGPSSSPSPRSPRRADSRRGDHPKHWI